MRYPTFATWVQQSRLAEGRTKTVAAKVRFAEVKLPATTGLPGVEVRLPDGTLVRGASEREVAAVVRTLRS